MSHIITYIETESEMRECLIRNRNSQYLAFDTEFFSTNTYFPTLSLLQINFGEEICVIDILKSKNFPKELVDMFHNEHILKIGHASFHDTRLLNEEFQIIPYPCFDTQIAAAFSRLGLNISYQKLVNQLLNKKISKYEQYRNWKTRPLPETAITYAQDDVRYLIELYHEFKLLFLDSRYVQWTIDETARSYQNKKADALQSWRDSLARKQNLPASKVITADKTHILRNLSDVNIDSIYKILPASLHSEAKSVFEILSSLKMQKTTFNNNLYHSLYVLRNLVSDEVQLPSEWICTTSNLRFIEQNLQLPQDILHSWRYELFGKIVESFLSGNFVLQVRNSKVVYTPLK